MKLNGRNESERSCIKLNGPTLILLNDSWDKKDCCEQVKTKADAVIFAIKTSTGFKPCSSNFGGGFQQGFCSYYKLKHQIILHIMLKLNHFNFILFPKNALGQAPGFWVLFPGLTRILHFCFSRYETSILSWAKFGIACSMRG